MLCKINIYSIKKEIYPWKKNNLLDDNISLQINEIFGIGIIYNKLSYIFSTSHNIDINSKFYCDEKELKLLYINKDLDVLIFENNINLNCTELYNLNLDFHEDSIFTNNNLDNLIILNYINIIESNITIIGPNVLLINCILNKDSMDIENGFSGLPVKDYNNCNIGLISRCCNKNIHIIPFINFITVINNNNNLGYFYEEVTFFQEHLMIDKKCNKYYYDKFIKSDKFNKKDIILSVDDNILVNGYLYNDFLKINISIYIYMLYFKKIKDLTSFLINRKNKQIKLNIYVNKYLNLINIKDEYCNEYELNDKFAICKLNLDILMDLLRNKKTVEYPNNFLENITNNKKFLFIENI